MGSPWRNPSILGRGSRRVALAAVVALGCGGILAAHGGIASRRVLDAVVAAARDRGVQLQAARATLGWDGAVTLAAVRVRAPGIAAEADRLSLRPRWSALARGRRELAAVRIDGAVVDLDADALSPGALRGPSNAGASSRGDAGPGTLLIDARELRASLRGTRLPVTTWTLSRLAVVVRTAGNAPSATVEAVLPSGAAASATVALAGGIRTRASVRDLRWDDFPPELRDALAVTAAGSLAVDVELELDGDAELARLRLAARAASADLTLSGAAVGDDTVGPLALRGTVAVGWARADGRVIVDDATLEVGPGAELVLRARGDARLVDGEPVHASCSIAVPDTARLVAVLPASLQPPAGAPPLGGGLTGEVALDGPWARPLEWTARGKLELGAMRAAARLASPLASSFAVRLTGADGREREVVVGPESADFVPLAELPSVVVDAVVTSEDGGFWAHQGFDFDEIEHSLVAVAAARRAVRGGSTISQQLAKNLFLTREKTFARKVREALVTLGLESSLSKARLLEIYLNVIEWGPDLRGIGPAAQAYFDEDARALTARQAAYLASIIPNPVRYYAQYERREVSAAWGARLDTILTHMTLHGRLDAASYARALREPIVFRD